MELLYKPDWEKTKENLTAWWAHEDFGRCGIAVTANKTGLPDAAPPPLPERIEDRWLDTDYLRAEQEYRMKRIFYGGEAFPVQDPGSQWMYNACFVGCPVDITETSGWIVPVIKEGELTDYDYNDLIIRDDNPWWISSLEKHRIAVEDAAGKAIPCMQTLGGAGDTLAGIRGNEQLLADTMDCPDYVKEFDQYLMKQWIDVHRTFYEIIKDGAEGCTTWAHMGIWAPGPYYIAMCDFSYMISTKMFTDLFLPSIEMQADYLDYCLYHVDGIGAFKHVDILCEVNGIQAIQILPGAGKPSPLHYMDELKKVQNAGKNLHMFLAPQEVKPALENLSSKGLFITTWCDTEEEAGALLRLTEKESKVRKIV